MSEVGLTQQVCGEYKIGRQGGREGGRCCHNILKDEAQSDDNDDTHVTLCPFTPPSNKYLWIHVSINNNMDDLAQGPFPLSKHHKALFLTLTSLYICMYM